MKQAILCVVSDTDPDTNLPFLQKPRDANPDSLWQGVIQGIPALRSALQKTHLNTENGHFPITWLLRADRQICEVYQDASFCFRQFEGIWKREVDLGSEIGWHPHLYFWNERSHVWAPRLGKDDDVDILRECLSSLRQYADIRAVRTGWDYHSNNLMGLFDVEGMLVDASAIPNNVVKQGVAYNSDWEGAPRKPYHPSSVDYRRPPASHEQALGILEMPIAVRHLNLQQRFLRYCKRNFIALYKHQTYYKWSTSLWRGQLLAYEWSLFGAAMTETLAMYIEEDYAFLITHFHPNQLLSKKLFTRCMANLERLGSVAYQMGYHVIPSTLSSAALLWQERAA
jgi:hypothetical protein